jgi:surface antigen
MTTLSHRDMELLMAYADGELSPEDAAEVEALLTVDPEARTLVARFLTERSLIAEAYGVEAAHATAAPETAAAGQGVAPMPAGRASAPTADAPIGGRPGDRSTRRRLDSARRAAARGGGVSIGFPALAASLALLVSGVAAGFLAGQALERSDARALTAAALSDLAETQRAALSAALEGAPNGQTHTWRVADGSAGGSITPTVTYVAEDGAFCREVETTADILGRTHDAVGIACREDGRWRVRYWVVENPDAAAGLGL